MYIIYKNTKVETDLTADLIYLLALLLEELVFLKNPVTKGNNKLKEKLRNIVFKPNRDRIIRYLCAYLNENETLDLESYVTFMLKGYSQKIDDILYSSMKEVFF